MLALFALCTGLLVAVDGDADPAATAEAAPRVEDPSGVALDGFYAALARVDGGTPGTLARVMHIGDSSIGRDGLPHAIRRRMQARFGDGGAGFVLLARKSENYDHRAALLTSSGWNVCYLAYKCDGAGHYGYGGHIARGRTGAKSMVRTRRSGEAGTTVSRMELWYEDGPAGGPLQWRVDDGEWSTIDTNADELRARWHRIDVEPGAHTFELRSRSAARPRAFGVVFETDGPGVVWDTISMIGAFTRRLLWFDQAHIDEQIAHRAPDLLVLGFGGNDLRRVAKDALAHDVLVGEIRQVLQRLRHGRPQLACLVVSISDHQRAGNVQLVGRHVTAVVAAQRAAAAAEGCGFFDTLAAMGGPGSVRKWRKVGLMEPDMQHLSMTGRDRMGGLIFDALMAGYDGYLRREATARR
jgi:lysophospholipase L1-like esterase